MKKDMRVLMERGLPPEVASLLYRMGELAEHHNVQLFLVGGVVRDLILEVNTVDLDLVVDGEPRTYLLDVREVLGATIQEYSEFGTATLHLVNGLRIDVARTRREHYPHPASLPVAEPGSLEEDLTRRDFTINTMAICMNPTAYGQLIDPHHGEDDLHHGLIRILHPDSFRDDPTRILRAARFAARYNFTLEPNTREALHVALDSGMIELLTPERIRHELVLGFSEQRAVRVVELLKRWGVLPHLHPQLDTDDMNAVLSAAEWTQKMRYCVKADQWLVLVLALVGPLHHEEAQDIGTRLGLRRIEIDKLFSIKNLEKKLKVIYKKETLRPSQVSELLDGLSPEVLLYGMARSPQKAQKLIHHYLFHWQSVNLEMNGTVLREWGVPEGPIYAEVLSAVLAAKRDGQVSSRDEEVALARQMLSSKGITCKERVDEGTSDHL